MVEIRRTDRPTDRPTERSPTDRLRERERERENGGRTPFCFWLVCIQSDHGFFRCVHIPRFNELLALLRLQQEQPVVVFGAASSNALRHRVSATTRSSTNLEIPTGEETKREDASERGKKKTEKRYPFQMSPLKEKIKTNAAGRPFV